MRLRTFLPTILVISSCAAGAHAQSIPPSAVCPTLPNTMDDLQWVMLQTEGALLCRAVRKEDGTEGFALTMTRKSPFKPVGSLREEEGRIQGRKLWWYRSEISGRPNELVRETLVKLDPARVVHVFIRTTDAGTLSHYQRVVENLDFSVPNATQRR
jgi:hypothetical protein